MKENWSLVRSFFLFMNYFALSAFKSTSSYSVCWEETSRRKSTEKSIWNGIECYSSAFIHKFFFFVVLSLGGVQFSIKPQFLNVVLVPFLRWIVGNKLHDPMVMLKRLIQARPTYLQDLLVLPVIWSEHWVARIS